MALQKAKDLHRREKSACDFGWLWTVCIYPHHTTTPLHVATGDGSDNINENLCNMQAWAWIFRFQNIWYIHWRELLQSNEQPTDKYAIIMGADPPIKSTLQLTINSLFLFSERIFLLHLDFSVLSNLYTNLASMKFRYHTFKTMNQLRDAYNVNLFAIKFAIKAYFWNERIANTLSTNVAA